MTNVVDNSAEFPWLPCPQYPDTNIQAADPAFNDLFVFSAGVRRVSCATQWGEGPVWFGDHNSLLWSDLPANRVLRYDVVAGTTSVFRADSRLTNGAARDLQGRYLACEHATHSITRIEYDGSPRILVDSFEGKRLNSPNDVVVKSDGTIWFTDPPFGIRCWYDGVPAEQSLPGTVYRLVPETGEISAVVTDCEGPNGLAFSPDESLLYVIDTKVKPRLIRVYDVAADGRTVNGGRTLIDCGEGTSDGMAVDRDGNLWCGWGMGRADLNGVHVFNPAGKLLGHIELPERCGNLCFGGRHGDWLFMATGHSLFTLCTNTQGAAWA